MVHTSQINTDEISVDVKGKIANKGTNDFIDRPTFQKHTDRIENLTYAITIVLLLTTAGILITVMLWLADSFKENHYQKNTNNETKPIIILIAPQ